MERKFSNFCRTFNVVGSIRNLKVLIGLVSLGLLLDVCRAQGGKSRCYDSQGRAQRCMPEFVNAAFNVPVIATNTCGEKSISNEYGRPIEYCLQTGVTGATKSCSTCDASDPRLAHPAKYLTDFNNIDSMTWWQSETMLQDNVQYPSMVNLTLNLGKLFDITYVRLKFHSSRPESFAIYKQETEDSDWLPYQFYSASCEGTYRKRTRGIITKDDETEAICTNEYSDISPLTGGNVAFSTLEGRPSAYNFENSDVLQDWVTATGIRVVLNRMNTFGDEVFGDPNVLRSYFYAISDFAVGGRCKCNGHASECVKSTGQGLEERLVCRCEHNTMGPDCGECLPFYNNKPWQRASATDVHECEACDCNGKSSRCYFDNRLYEATGEGGHCLDCRENTAGPHCERCKDNYYLSREGRCENCACDPTGSESMQCDNNGRCRCKPGVGGDKCDRCATNFYDFSINGCRRCECLIAGSLDGRPSCQPDSGTCRCKEFVEGQNCDTCKPGYFNLDADNKYGCMSCFCYGHTSECMSAPGYSTKSIESVFDTGKQRWTAEDREGQNIDLKFDGFTSNIGISAGSQIAYFVAPVRYLGDQRNSYNQNLKFSLNVGEEGARASAIDVIIEGDGRAIRAPIFAQGNPTPSTRSQDFSFQLNEHPDLQWSPRMDGLEFIKILANITSIKIRGAYTQSGVGFLDNVELESAKRGNGGEEASWVEQCTCPPGYVGQYCESCAPGYRRDPPNGGPYARCVPCNCNGHSDDCDVNTGKCICQHNTAGDNCERCRPGWYGYALAGTENDCKQCPCPDGGSCAEMMNGDVACTNCKEGYAGLHCEICADGYFGDPQGKYGPRRPCQKCQCSGNIDPNAIANCNTTTGECLKCIYNTAGFYCDACLPGYYGDALGLPKGQCKACECYPPGTYQPGNPGDTLLCESGTGQCRCKFNVIGRKCDMCREGYWNVDSDNGCERCNCDRIGSYNGSCEIQTGQCNCKDGVGGRTCGTCQPRYFGFSNEGCQACQCDPDGSLDLQCDEFSGQCPCKANIEGPKCDRCQENKYNITAGCIDCPPCYSLVQEKVNIHRRKINELRILIKNIGKDPSSVDDADFRRRLEEMQIIVDELLQDARNAVGVDGPLAEELQKLKDAVAMVIDRCGSITNDVTDARDFNEKAKEGLELAERILMDTEEKLMASAEYIENDGKDAIREAREVRDRLEDEAGQGSKRMTEIAKLARDEADKQTEQAMSIMMTAQNALNTSNEALRLARQLPGIPDDVARKIEGLGLDFQDLQDLFDVTMKQAEEAREKAKDAYKDSLDIYAKSRDVNVPEIDVPALVAEAEEIKEEAMRIKAEADRLIDQYKDLIEDVSVQKEEAQGLLDDAERQQQITDELLADAHAAYSEGRDAVERAEETLDDAKNTLKTLLEFDEKVKRSKEEADEALKKIPYIEGLIEDAETKTSDANQTLSGARADARKARDFAKEAQRIAEEASKEAGVIRTEAGTTKVTANELNDLSDILVGDVDAARRRLEALEAQAEKDSKLAKEALMKAEEAKNSAQDSKSKVSGALDMVNMILDQLAGLDSIDTERLNELDVGLKNAETELVNINFTSRYNELEASRDRQRGWVSEYTIDYINIERDVENIRQINATIPRTCYNDVDIEVGVTPAPGR
ncbi:unnamed protein product [Owenia fusiformis]|uniref:Uncharacterized protein n=1 Tax=Owenia fusiformis TaxID=6347 RepID=A0A8J1YBG5_OWEFU|nr:unnamed protein product [Owenia fusiformis]